MHVLLQLVTYSLNRQETIVQLELAAGKTVADETQSCV